MLDAWSAFFFDCWAPTGMAIAASPLRRLATFLFWAALLLFPYGDACTSCFFVVLRTSAPFYNNNNKRKNKGDENVWLAQRGVGGLRGQYYFAPTTTRACRLRRAAP